MISNPNKRVKGGLTREDTDQLEDVDTLFSSLTSKLKEEVQDIQEPEKKAYIYR